MTFRWVQFSCLLLLAMAGSVFGQHIDIEAMSQQIRIVGLIEDLRDDHHRNNARRAVFSLHDMGPVVIRPLEMALYSTDRQQRMLAAGILGRRADYTPSSRVFEVCVEALQENLHFIWMQQVRDEAGKIIAHKQLVGGINPLWGAFDLLERFPDAAEPHLIAGLRSSDQRQRFVCAMLLVRFNRVRGDDALTKYISTLFIESLSDNRVYRDANLACRGLYLLGPEALPTIYAALPTDNRQAQSLLRHLIWHLAGPDAPQAKQLDRDGRLRKALCPTCHDPATGYPADRIPRGFNTKSARWFEPDA